MTTVHIYIILMVILIFICAFFSAAETAMMIINRYKLKHSAKSGNKYAVLILDLLKRPDRLLSVILICNTFATLLFSSLSTQWAISVFGNISVMDSVGLTLVTSLFIMIFCESTPKIFAALHPEWIAYSSALILRTILFILYPIIFFVTVTSNLILRLFGVSIKHNNQNEHLSLEELQTIISDSRISMYQEHKSMLISILDLRNATVEDIMTPKNEIVSIDINSSKEAIFDVLKTTYHQQILIYDATMDSLLGIINTKDLSNLEITKENLKKYIIKPYFIPEATTLIQQLNNFKKNKSHLALIVDEYGEIIGLVTMNDILREIIGEFASNLDLTKDLIQTTPEAYIIDATINIRELNKQLNWNLDVNGPKTLSGLIIKYLEFIPTNNVCLIFDKYKIEIIDIQNKKIETVKVYR